MAEIPHRLEQHDFVSHFRRVSAMFFHGALELRGVVALHIIDFEMFAEPLPDVLVRAFAADITELAHGIDRSSEVAEMGRMLLHELQMIEQMILYLFGYIVRPEADFFLRQEPIGKKLSPLGLPSLPIALFGWR